MNTDNSEQNTNKETNMTTHNADAMDMLLQLTDEPGSSRSPIETRYATTSFANAEGSDETMRTSYREIKFNGKRFLVQVVMLAIAVCMFGCAGTETRHAFTPQSPAFSVDPATLPPRMAARHEWNLHHAIDLAIKKQEQEDKLDQLMWIKE